MQIRVAARSSHALVQKDDGRIDRSRDVLISSEVFGGQQQEHSKKRRTVRLLTYLMRVAGFWPQERHLWPL